MNPWKWLCDFCALLRAEVVAEQDFLAPYQTQLARIALFNAQYNEALREDEKEEQDEAQS